MLRNCIRCGKLHIYPTKLCKDCLEEKKEHYWKVKNYLWDNPGSTIEEISEQTGVNQERIIQFVREDRFEVIDGIIEKTETPAGIK